MGALASAINSTLCIGPTTMSVFRWYIIVIYLHSKMGKVNAFALRWLWQNKIEPPSSFGTWLSARSVDGQGLTLGNKMSGAIKPNSESRPYNAIQVTIRHDGWTLHGPFFRAELDPYLLDVQARGCWLDDSQSQPNINAFNSTINYLACTTGYTCSCP